MKQKFTLFLLFATILANAQQKPSQQWLDQKYSMFIHFGLYSVYGGVYNGNRYVGAANDQSRGDIQ